jgi:hypothetical protein
VPISQLDRTRAFTRQEPGPKLPCEVIVSIPGNSFLSLRLFATLCFLLAGHLPALRAQETQQKPAEKSVDKTATPAAPEYPAQLSLLETHVRFEANGDSRKEVHTIVKINNELGVRQFARLNFDYNRSFEQIEIPQVRITHASGGTADILPSAITDNPNPAVVNAPAYQDVRVKSVRILGLEPGDTLEYRVVTTVSHHPLAPDFWLEHSFDRSGVVSHESFLIDAPAPRLRMRINPDTPATIEKSGEGDTSWVSYRWEIEPDKLKPATDSEEDISLTTFSSWSSLSSSISKAEDTGFGTFIYLEADRRGDAKYGWRSPQYIYNFVSQKIVTVDLPLELSISVRRGAQQIVESGYGTSEEKARLLSILMTQTDASPRLVMYGREHHLEEDLPRPNLLTGALLVMTAGTKERFLDPSLPVAPFGVVPPELRGRKALNINSTSKDTENCFSTIPVELPFSSSQHVSVRADLTLDGRLRAKVKYFMRGDNELLLRVAFHQAPREEWNDVAQLLSLADGFRGKIISATASDPYDTREPFTVEYEIEQQKFVDWSKKPVRIPAILPLVALPDPPAKPAPGTASSPIDLGTPLDVETKVTLQLPPGTSVRTPTGISVARDYATFASKYSAQGNTITASRHINFLLREVPAARAADYNAFVRAVQNDQSQDFTLERAESATPKTNSAAPVTAAPPKQQSPL